MTRRLRLNAEHGFTLAVSMGILLIASLVCIAAFQAANGDMLPSREQSNRKQAYAAAESGIAWYQTKLTGNPNYWQLCDTGTTNGVADPVTQPNATNRKWRTLTGTGPNTAEFTVAVLPSGTATSCSTSDPGSMLSPTDGTFRVRATGRYRGEMVSIITTFRRQRFLDFLYFTDYETLDPQATGSTTDCAKYRASRSSSCTTIQFASADKVNGPLHTNDDLVYCGNPTFGRTPADSIEVSGPAPGYQPNGGSCGPGPVFKGTFRSATRQLQMPPSNAGLKPLTTPCCSGSGYYLTGTQYIRLTGDSMVLDTPAGNPQSVPLPPNGVIYVDDPNPCSLGTNTISNERYTESDGCANVYVSGTANQSITIASAHDIIIAPTTAYVGTDTTRQFDPDTAGASWSDANLTVSGSVDADHQLAGNVQIGLIADRFVRVYHRVNSGALASGVRNVRIDAAILSLQHSFIVDNWDEGPSPGTLTVHGAIAQRFRGTVGTGSGGSISTGYVKDYWYDNRFKYRSPPYFLDPVNAAWSVGKQHELAPPV